METSERSHYGPNVDIEGGAGHNFQSISTPAHTCKMEAIPESPSSVHFFKLLELLAPNNAVRPT